MLYARSAHVLVHESLVKVGSQHILPKNVSTRLPRQQEQNEEKSTYVDKLLLLAAVLGASRLVLKDDVVVPSPLNVEVLLVEQRVSKSNVALAGVFFLLCSLSFFALLLLFALATYTLQLPLQLGVVVLVTIVRIVIVVLLFLVTVIRIRIPRRF